MGSNSSGLLEPPELSQEDTPSPRRAAAPPPVIADYDADGYDYRDFWCGRAYEQWAEARVLRRLLRPAPERQWLVDFGAGYGRNAPHYARVVGHAVLVDYSLGNLERAAQQLAASVTHERLFLVRADLYRLPFIDGAFDIGLLIRVLHHLTHIDAALAEMGRTVGREWILDVPIKHHVLARLRSRLRGDWRALSTWTPKSISRDERPFMNFHLDAVRQQLNTLGWETEIVASVNNFRRWEQRLPPSLVAGLRPVVYGCEALVQTLGRGWWGPSQFVYARRRELEPRARRAADPHPVASSAAGSFTERVVCPQCQCRLSWGVARATCTGCSRTFLPTGGVWDFVRTRSQ
jgi:SAM-dependent methyltransferase